MAEELNLEAHDDTTASPEKRSYHAPVLREHGSVNDVTRSGPTEVPDTEDSATGYMADES
jgi:hypothetical protein